MVVKGDLNNYGTINELAGTIKGQLTNFGDASISSLSVENRVFNNGTITTQGGLLLFNGGLDGAGRVEVRGAEGLEVMAPAGGSFELSNRVVLHDAPLGIGGDGFVSVGGGLVTGSGQLRGNIGGLVVAEGAGNEITLIDAGSGGGGGGGISYRGAPVLGTGTLLARGGGAIRFEGSGRNDGLVHVADGGELRLTGGATITGGGRVQIDAGGVLRATSSVTFTNNVVSGSGTVFGNIFISGGSISPGSSPGTITFADTLSLGKESSLLMELAGYGEARHDLINVGGQLNIDGLLEIRLIDGFRPKLGDSFPILNYRSALGTFDAVNVVGGGSGYLFSPVYGPTGTTLLTLAVPVPEPAATGLFGITAVALARRRRRVV